MPKTVLITGGATNLGAAVAKKFAKNNWNIVINYNKSQSKAFELVNQINNTALQKNDIISQSIAIQADITQPDEVENLFNMAKKQFNRIDVLLNNAGIYPSANPISEMELLQWNSTINLNLTAGMLTAKEFIKQNIKEGRIVNTASVGGKNIFKNRIDYNVSKAAMIRLTEVLAKELAPHTSVNCVCPGVIELENAPINSNDFKIPCANSIPMQRYATIEDIFDAIYFFANSSHYITGQTLFVTGGLEL